MASMMEHTTARAWLRITWDVFGLVAAVLIGGALLISLQDMLFGQTRIAPDQIRGAQVLVMSCTESNTTTSDCTGLVFVDITRADGSHVKVLGTPPPAQFAIDPAKWSQVALGQ